MSESEQIWLISDEKKTSAYFYLTQYYIFTNTDTRSTNVYLIRQWLCGKQQQQYTIIFTQEKFKIEISHDLFLKDLRFVIMKLGSQNMVFFRK